MTSASTKTVKKTKKIIDENKGDDSISLANEESVDNAKESITEYEGLKRDLEKEQEKIVGLTKALYELQQKYTELFAAVKGISEELEKKEENLVMGPASRKHVFNTK